MKKVPWSHPLSTLIVDMFWRGYDTNKSIANFAKKELNVEIVKEPDDSYSVIFENESQYLLFIMKFSDKFKDTR